MSSEPLQLERAIWYGSQDDSPELAPDEFGLRIAVVDAQGELGPTVALLANARVSGQLGERYGGRLPGATRIVAVEQETGQLYQGNAEPFEAAPLIPASLEAPDVPPSDDEPEQLSVEVQFNVDLGVILDLPPIEGTYWVFAWLDDVVSNVLAFELPADDMRHGQPAARPEMLSNLHVNFPGSDAPEVGQAALVLGDALAESGPLGDRLRVAGRAATGMFGDEEDAPRFLTVLVRREFEREVHASTAITPETFTEEGTFEFDALALCGKPSPPERMYAIALYGDEVSRTLVIEPDKLA